MGDPFYKEHEGYDGDDDYYTENGVYGDDVYDENGTDEDSENEDVIEEKNLVSTSNSMRITGDNRKTTNTMNKYELSRLISTLAKLYEKNFIVHPKLKIEARSRSIFDSLDLAELHMYMKEIPYPIQLKRRMPDGTEEIWRVRDMILPHELLSRK